MDHRLGRTLVALVLAALAATFATAAEEPARGIVLSSGEEGGGYWNAATRLKRVAAEMRLDVEVLPSSGSVENLARLFDQDSPVNLAFAQSDAVQHYLNSYETVSVQLEMLENIGQECIFIVTNIDSDLYDDEDLREAESLSIGIPSATSGVAVTLAYLASQMPELAQAGVRYGDTLVALEQLGTPEASVDAIMMIHRPKERSPAVNEALSKPDRYRFLQLSEDMLQQKLWNGRKIYRSMKLALPGAAEPLETICVRGLLLANRTKLSLEQRNRLSDLVSYNWMRIYTAE